MVLLPPSRVRNRSGLADWVEIRALTSPRGFITSNEIYRLINSDSDGDDHGTEFDSVTGEALETEIIESKADGEIERLYKELQYRSDLCGQNYPFSVIGDEGEKSFAGAFRVVSHFNEPSAGNKYTFYILGLLETGVRDKIVSPKNIVTTHHHLGLLFQVASCLALGCYLRGDTVWFGFPRPDHTSFLPALTKAFARYGCHTIPSSVPPGFPTNLKDAGIDIIAWINFGDSRGASTIVCGQVASGNDWSTKTLLGFMAKFANWFTPPALAHLTPAILIPFPIHHSLEENKEKVWEDEANGKMLYDSSEFGVIFDRFRIAKFAAAAFDLPEEVKSKIDGFDQIEMVTAWIAEILSELQLGEAA